LARLDHAILPVLIVLTNLGRPAPGNRRLDVRFWLVCGGTMLAVWAAYMIINVAYSGSALPVSGQLKSTFPDPVRDSFVHTVNFFRDSQEIGSTLRVRLAQLVVPLVVVVAWGVIGRRRSARPTQAGRAPGPRGTAGRPAPSSVGPAPASKDRYREFLVLTAWMVVALFVYDYLYVRPYDQGFWYTPVSVVFVSLLGLHAVASTRWHQRLVQSPRGVMACALLLAAATIAFYAAAFRRTGGEKLAEFYYVHAPQARSHYAGTPPPKLLANDDGLVAYALGYPTMNAIGLALDQGAARAAGRSHLQLFEVAHARGFDRFTSSHYTRGYRTGTPVQASATDAELRNWFGLTSEELPGHHLRVDFVSRDGLLVIARFVPKAAR
jgi:hypothetical protein